MVERGVLSGAPRPSTPLALVEPTQGQQAQATAEAALARTECSETVTTITPVAAVAVPVDVELARLMVALGVPPAVVLTYWIARSMVAANANAGGRVPLADLRAALASAGLCAAGRTLDRWIARGQAAELWRVHGKGKRRELYIRGHRRLCAHFASRAAAERPAAAETNLPGKLWSVLELTGATLSAAAIIGKFWAAWYFTRERTHRLSHATDRDLWNRSRQQLNAARRAADVMTGRPGRVFHPHELAPERAYPAVFDGEHGVVVIPMTHAANAYTTTAAILTHRRARRSNHAAYAAAFDAFALQAALPHAPATDGAGPTARRVPESRLYFEHESPAENDKRARKAITRENTTTARARITERSLSANGDAADYFEQMVVGATVSAVPVPYHADGRRYVGRLSRRQEAAYLDQTGGLEHWRWQYAAPYREAVPRRLKREGCA